MNIKQYLDAKHREVGDKFDTSEIAPEFFRYYGTGIRLEVTGPSGVRRGTVGVTSGWRPMFLLMHRKSDIGSSDVLTKEDKVTGIVDKRGKITRIERN